jgi:hypothetical protein
VFFLGSLSLLAVTNDIKIGSPDFATLISIGTYVGVGGLLVFGILLIGQASTVIDSALNYIASLGSIDWTHKETVNVSRLFMFGFLVVVWFVSWLKIDIWTLFVLMSAIRATMFVPLVLHALDKQLNENWLFYSSILGILSALYFSIQSKITSTPQFDLYAMICALGIPLTGYFLSRYTRN